MTSTSSESRVLRGLPEGRVVAAGNAGDLRRGSWTRLGTEGLRGDEATESTLSALAARSSEAGRAQGYAVGWAEGLRAAQTAAAELHDEGMAAMADLQRQVLADQQSAAAALQRTLGQAEQLVSQALAQLADQVVDVAMAVAESVIGREVASATDPGADAIRRAIATVPLDVQLVVRMHPEDVQALDPAVLETRTVTLVPDPRLSRGDAVVESETAVVDATLGAALSRVREVLAR